MVTCHVKTVRAFGVELRMPRDLRWAAHAQDLLELRFIRALPQHFARRGVIRRVS